MRTLNEVRELAHTYGISALTDKEAIRLISKSKKVANGEIDFMDFFRTTEGKAVLSLAQRYNNELEKKRVKKIICSKDCYNLFLPILQEIDMEQFWIVFLNKANNVIGKPYFHSKGGVSATVVDVKLIVKEALKVGASGLIMAHNHPSGEVNPSNQDNNITKKIKDACSLMDIAMLDHIIVGENKYYSYADEGIL